MGGAINNFARFESMQKGLETFFQDADKGKQKFEELRRLSNVTTFGVDELAQSFTELANVGVNVDTINDKLLMLGNLAGGSKQKFSDLVSIYSKIQSTGSAGAMQIQQLARQGLPIIENLKKMGVQGTASAMDITKAFREMTAQGGQFYNAMENINSTIEGKRGVISDYFKEFSVNFAEITGLADAYKVVLDLVSDAIAVVSDKLLEWNNNPVMKGIISGVFVTALGFLATTIAVSLVGAIKKLNANLAKTVILKSILDPKTLIVAGAIGAIAGLSIGIASAVKKMKELKETAEGANTEIKKMSSIDVRQDFVKQYEEIKKGLEEQLAGVQNQKRNLSPKTNFVTGKVEKDELKKYFAQMKVFEEQENAIRAKIEGVNSVIDFNKGKINQLNTEMQNAIDLTEQYDASLKKLQTTYAGTNKGKQEALEKEIKEYQNLLNGGKGFRNGEFVTLGLSKEDELKAKKAIQNLQKEIRKLNPIENLIYQNQILDSYNAQEASLDNLINKTYELKTLEMDLTEEEKKKYIELLKQNELKDRLAKKKQNVSTKYNDLNVRNAEADNVLSAMTSLEYQKSDVKKQQAIIYGIMNGISTQQAKQLLMLEKEVSIKEKLIETETAMQDALDNFDIEGFFTAMQSHFGEKLISGEYSASDVGKYAGANAMNHLTSVSGDASNAVEGFQQGGVWGAIINTLLGALAKVASSIEGAEDVLNPVTSAMEQLKPIIQFFLKIMSRFQHHLEAVFNIVGQIFEALEPLVEVLFDLIEPVNAIISIVMMLVKTIVPLIKMFASAIATIIKVLTFGLLDVSKDLNDSFAETRQKTDDINKNYDSMLQNMKNLTIAMQEQQEEYLRRKKELNSQSYSSAVTGVHDMILTPQGQFSTDPDDYIIATKNPHNLGGGGSAQVNIVVNNTIAQTADVSVTRSQGGDGNEQLLIQISKKVAGDYATGRNGWDSAVSSRERLSAGRSLSL